LQHINETQGIYPRHKLTARVVNYTRMKKHVIYYREKTKFTAEAKHHEACVTNY